MSDLINRFQLRPYRGKSTRHRCPNCGSPLSFARYVDVTTGQDLAPQYGYCNRREKCGYHNPPDHDYLKEYTKGTDSIVTSKDVLPEFIAPTGTSYLDPRTVLSIGGKYTDNLSRFLLETFAHSNVYRVLSRYFLGSVESWGDEATVFWQIDVDFRIRTGKVMLYNPRTGKRVKEPNNRINWLHNPHQTLLDEDVEDYALRQVFFGTHLINQTSGVINIAESEKTAIINTIVKPNSTWLATGGLELINGERLEPLKGRKLVFYPDKGEAFGRWTEKLEPFRNDFDIEISDFMEEKNMEPGSDIGDYLIGLYSKNKTNA